MRRSGQDNCGWAALGKGATRRITAHCACTCFEIRCSKVHLYVLSVGFLDVVWYNIMWLFMIIHEVICLTLIVELCSIEDSIWFTPMHAHTLFVERLSGHDSLSSSLLHLPPPPLSPSPSLFIFFPCLAVCMQLVVSENKLSPTWILNSCVTYSLIYRWLKQILNILGVSMSRSKHEEMFVIVFSWGCISFDCIFKLRVIWTHVDFNSSLNHNPIASPEKCF